MNVALHSDCRLCGSASRFAFEQVVIGRPVRYYDCETCGYFQTETPTWLDQAYAEPINSSDTGILQRNVANVGKVVMTLAAARRLDGTVVDHAGGYGILVRLLRDAGVNAFWSDLYCDNIVARGFEAGGTGPYDLLTAFEVLEHLVQPLPQLQEMLGKAPMILSTTELIADGTAPRPDWWYLGTDHGQHIGFFRPRTLAFAAERLGCHVATDGRRTHLFAREPIPAHWPHLLKLSRLWRLLGWARLRSKTAADSARLAGARRAAAQDGAGVAAPR